MRTTTAPAATGVASLFVGGSAEVLDKTPAATLAMVAEQRRVQARTRRHPRLALTAGHRFTVDEHGTTAA